MGQREYLPGYVVLNSGDTLHGYLKDHSPGSFGKKFWQVRYRKEQRQFGSKRYSPYEIIAYVIDGAHYKSMWLNSYNMLFREFYNSTPNRGRKEFLRLMISGPVSLYHLESDDSENGNINFVPLFKKEGESEMQRATQGILGLKKNRLSEYFSDCPELVSRIQNGQIDSPEEVADFYNDRKNCN